MFVRHLRLASNGQLHAGQEAVVALIRGRGAVSCCSQQGMARITGMKAFSLQSGECGNSGRLIFYFANAALWALSTEATLLLQVCLLLAAGALQSARVSLYGFGCARPVASGLSHR